MAVLFDILLCCWLRRPVVGCLFYITYLGFMSGLKILSCTVVRMSKPWMVNIQRR